MPDFIYSLSKAHGRYHRWRKIGGKLQAVRNISPTTAIGLETNNFELQKIQMSICRDREEWFPGREWTASRLKERGKELVVDLQEIVT